MTNYLLEERQALVTDTENSTEDLNETFAGPEVICGCCGARERYIGKGKTECPNCEDSLD